MWHKLREAVAAEGVEVIVEPTAQRWFSDEFKAANPKALQDVRNMIRAPPRSATSASPRCSSASTSRTGSARSRPRRCISGAEDRLGAARADGAREKVPGAQHRRCRKPPGHIANIQNPAVQQGVGDFQAADLGDDKKLSSWRDCCSPAP